MSVKKVMNHSEYMAKVKLIDDEGLKFIITDCRDSIKAMPQGENEGYYQDEIHYCSMELKERQDKGEVHVNINELLFICETDRFLLIDNDKQIQSANRLTLNDLGALGTGDLEIIDMKDKLSVYSFRKEIVIMSKLDNNGRV